MILLLITILLNIIFVSESLAEHPNIHPEHFTITKLYHKATRINEGRPTQIYNSTVVAQRRLGTIYFSGSLVDCNYSEALYWYSQAAKLGDAISQNNLGDLYLYGKGVEPDPKVAAMFFFLAAKQGQPVAQSNLGFMYEYGLGVPHKAKQAKYYYNLAAANGHLLAQDRLNRLYEKDVGVGNGFLETLRYLIVKNREASL